MDEKQKNKGLLYFSTLSYPTFGRGVYSESSPPNTVVSSPYYWWFKFLQLNEEYKATVEKNGIGKLKDLYGDFNDIFNVDFKQWWKEHVFLFAEPKKRYSMRIANSYDELAPFNSDEVVNLVVPLNWNRRSLKKHFHTLILNKVEKSKKGLNVDASEAKYKINGRWRIDAMQIAYSVYVCKKENPSLTWADIAAKTNLSIAKEYSVGEKNYRTKDLRRVATSATIRHYKRALKFIESAATNSFPH